MKNRRTDVYNDRRIEGGWAERDRKTEEQKEKRKTGKQEVRNLERLKC